MNSIKIKNNCFNLFFIELIYINCQGKLLIYDLSNVNVINEQSFLLVIYIIYFKIHVAIL